MVEQSCDEDAHRMVGKDNPSWEMVAALVKAQGRAYLSRTSAASGNPQRTVPMGLSRLPVVSALMAVSNWGAARWCRCSIARAANAAALGGALCGLFSRGRDPAVGGVFSSAIKIRGMHTSRRLAASISDSLSPQSNLIGRTMASPYPTPLGVLIPVAHVRTLAQAVRMCSPL
jgi:hypothetical protein